ncbi:MAG: thiamine pyrophosphate-binding protein [Microbacteriaceae bacterium]|nr:thiamine pyrophosphate-binding protein [Microbacteriaceae bacterium]
MNTRTLSSVKTVADLVVETLTELGVSKVFGIPGQHALALFDSLNRSKLELVSSRVENNSVFQADGYSRVSNQVSVVFLSTGPGALLALAALQEAYASSTPLLVIASQIPRKGLDNSRHGLLHELEDNSKSVANVVKAYALVDRAEQIVPQILNAWKQSITAPQGPVWIDIPQDLLTEITEIPKPSFQKIKPEKITLDFASLDKAIEVIDSSNRTVVIVGGGLENSPDARQTLKTFAEKANALVLCTPASKGRFDFSHPLSLGSWVEDEAVTNILNTADAVLALGTAIGEITSNGFSFDPRGTLIQVNADVRTLGANYKALAIQADALVALKYLAEHINVAAGNDAEAVAKDALEKIENHLAEQDLAYEVEFLKILRDTIPKNSATFWDMTIAGYWAWSAWDAKEGEFHSAQGAGGLGFAFPAAIGGAIASDKRTYAVSGDGGAMYSIAELASAKQHKVNVTWVIVNDGGYGILKHYMDSAFGTSSATDLFVPDFVKLAEAFDIPASEVNLGTIADQIIASNSQEGPSVLVLNKSLSMFTESKPTSAIESEKK